MRLLIAQDASQALIQLCWRQGSETEASVKRCIPRHIGEGGQRDRLQTTAARSVDGLAQKAPAQPFALGAFMHRELMDVQFASCRLRAEEADRPVVIIHSNPAIAPRQKGLMSGVIEHIAGGQPSKTW